MVDKSTQNILLFGILISIGLVATVFVLTSSFEKGMKSIADQQRITSQDGIIKDGVGLLRCPDVTITGETAFRNPLNSSTQYQAGSVAYVDNDGNIVATDTATGGNTLSWESANILCTANTYNNGLYIYAVADTTRNSGMSTLQEFDGGTGIQSEVEQSSASILEGALLDGTFTNLSLTDDALAYSAGTNGATVNINETTAVAMSAGISRAGYFDLWATTGSTEFGGPKTNEGIIIAIDTVDSSAFGDKDISLAVTSGNAVIREVLTTDTKYSRVTSKRSANRLYVMDSISSSVGYIRFSWTMRNGGGSDAGASSDPIIYFDAMNYYKDSDSKIKYGAFDSGNTAVGIAGTKVTFNNS